MTDNANALEQAALDIDDWVRVLAKRGLTYAQILCLLCDELKKLEAMSVAKVKLEGR